MIRLNAGSDWTPAFAGVTVDCIGNYMAQTMHPSDIDCYR